MFDAIVYVPKLDQGIDIRLLSKLRSVSDRFNIPLLEDNNDLPFSYTSRILFVPFGGDGTMLAAMRSASKFEGGSVFGINGGRLGFLTNSGKEEDLDRMLLSLIENPSEWKTDRRMLIRATTVAAANKNESIAVNEFLVTTPTRRHPLRYDIFINGNYVATHNGDGVIVTTATGSTAYSMSAGGAIMAPTSRAIQITPLAAHTLTSRPIVVSEDDNVMIRASLTSRVKEVQVFADGGLVASSAYGQSSAVVAHIRKYHFVDIWRPKDWNFFSVLSEKMGWGL